MNFQNFFHVAKQEVDLEILDFMLWMPQKNFQMKAK